MKTSKVSSGELWAITPGGYTGVQSQREALLKHTDRTPDASMFGADDEGGVKRAVNVRNGVAEIKAVGVFTNDDSYYASLFGGAVIPVIKKQLQAAEDDPEVGAALLVIESPGGPVRGIDGLSDFISDMKKPVVVYSDGVLCSGAIWAGSAADKVVVSRTASVGSIGVMAVFKEYSAMQATEGIKVEVMTAGKHKAVGSSEKPMTDEDKAIIQAELDYTYGLFKSAVARNRFMSDEAVDAMADGKIYVGQQAVDAGMVDAVGTYGAAFDMAVSLKDWDYGGKVKYPKTEGGKMKTIEELKAAHPDLVEQIAQQAMATVDISAAVAKETTRIMALAKAQFTDGEKFVALVESGVTVDQFMAIKGLEAPVAPAAPAVPAVPEASAADEKAAMLAAITACSAADPGSQTPASAAPVDYMAAWQGIKTAEGCTTQEAMSRASKRHPDLYNRFAGHGATA